MEHTLARTEIKPGGGKTERNRNRVKRNQEESQRDGDNITSNSTERKKNKSLSFHVKYSVQFPVKKNIF